MSDELDKAGWITLILTWFIGVWQWIVQHGNETIVVISGLLGITFLIFKIRLTILEHKLKQKKLDRYKNIWGIDQKFFDKN